MSRRRKGSRLAGFAILAAVAGAVAAGVVGFWLGQSTRPSARVVVLGPAPESTVSRPPVAPTPSGVPSLQPPAQPGPAPRQTGSLATPPGALQFQAAIIFDDAGGSPDDVEEIVAIGRPAAVAVLPGLAYSADVARRSRAAGLEVLFHLPVESADDRALGPGGVTVAMSDAEIHGAVRSGLASVPGAVGVNNHMGSKGTADRRVMRAVVEAVREAGLFFIDSRTTAETVGESVATELGVPTAARAVFLDNENDEDAIRAQVRRLITLARERGAAIAIGHVRRRTARVLGTMLDEFERAGVAIVPPSTLV
ncbi:MAG: divergent polysaccharide deacetylase family protein, partial [bacterium]